MIHLLSGVLVDSNAGVVTPEMLRRWASNPCEAHKAKECITAFDDSYRKMEQHIGNYVLAHALSSDKSMFALNPVGFGSIFYPHDISWLGVEVGETVVVRGKCDQNMLVVPQMDSHQYDWDRAVSFTEGLVVRVLCPPKLLEYWVEEELGEFQFALSQLECSFHTHYATWLMLATCFPNSTLAEWCGVAFRSFGWDTSLSIKPVNIFPVERKLHELLEKNSRFRALFHAHKTSHSV